MKSAFKIKYLIIVILLSIDCVFCLTSFAETKENPAPVIDLYKSNQLSAKVVEKKYKIQFQKIADIFNSPDSMNSKKNIDICMKSMFEILTGIKKMGDFSYVNITPIIYPNVKTIYFSIDIVDKKDKARLSYFTAKPTKNIPDPDGLIQSWLEYEKVGNSILYKNKTAPIFKSCPAIHCTYGFDDPRLKKYLPVFSQLVPKDKDQLIVVLRKDKDENKRAAAAFLLAHINNKNELIKILTPSIKDPSSSVRNNAMRVIAATLAGMKNPDFPINEAVLALNFPEALDRNKALYILSSLAKQPRYANYLLQHAQNELLDDLELSQPNIHEFSYIILKLISGKDFGEHNYQAWKRWLQNNKNIHES